MAGVTWNKAAGGGLGAALATYAVDLLNQAATIYLQMPMPDIAQLALVGLLTGVITYYVPANVVKGAPADSGASGV